MWCKSFVLELRFKDLNAINSSWVSTSTILLISSSLVYDFLIFSSLVYDLVCNVHILIIFCQPVTLMIFSSLVYDFNYILIIFCKPVNIHPYNPQEAAADSTQLSALCFPTATFSIVSFTSSTFLHAPFSP